MLSGPVLGERLGRTGWWGSGLALVGALVAGAHHLVAGGGSVAGLGLLLLGLVGFASGTLYQKRTGATMDLRTGTAVQLLAGAVAVLPVALRDRARPAAPDDRVRARPRSRGSSW